MIEPKDIDRIVVEIKHAMMNGTEGSELAEWMEARAISMDTVEYVIGRLMYLFVKDQAEMGVESVGENLAATVSMAFLIGYETANQYSHTTAVTE